MSELDIQLGLTAPTDPAQAAAQPIGGNVAYAQQPEQETSFIDAAVAARHMYGTSNWMYRGIKQSAIPVDPNYTLSQNYDEVTKDIPNQWLPSLNEKLAEARSAEEAWSIRDQFAQEMDWQQKIAAQGWKGAAATLAMGLFDEGNIALGFLGPIALLGRGTKIAKTLRNASRLTRYSAFAAAGAAEGAALEAAGVFSSQTRHPVDILYAAAFAGMFGTLAGRFAAPKELPTLKPEVDLHIPEPDVGAPHANNHTRAETYTEGKVMGMKDVPDLEDAVAHQADADILAMHDQTIDPEGFVKGAAEAPTARPIMDDLNLQHAKAQQELDAKAVTLNKRLEELAAEHNPAPVKPVLLDAVAALREVMAREVNVLDRKAATLHQQELTNAKRAMIAAVKQDAPDAFAASDLKKLKNSDLPKFLEGDLKKFVKASEAEHAKSLKDYETRNAQIDTEVTKIKGDLEKIAKDKKSSNEKFIAEQAKQAEAQSIGAAQAEHTPPSQMDIPTDKVDEIVDEARNMYVPSRLRRLNSMWARGVRDGNSYIKWITGKLMTNHAGSTTGDVQAIGAVTKFRAFEARVLAPFNRDFNANYNKWRTETKGKFRSWFADQQAQREFAHLVSDAIEGVGNAADNEFVSKAAKAAAHVFAQTKKFAEDAGLEGWDKFATRDDYLPHIHDMFAANRLQTEFRLPGLPSAGKGKGWGVANELVYKAFRAANPDADRADVIALAKKYVDVVHHKQAGQRGAYLDIQRAHETGYIRSCLEAFGMDSKDVDQLDALFTKVLGPEEGPDVKARHGRAKKRTPLDMNTEISVLTPDGEPTTVSIRDLFKRDVTQLVHGYVRSVGGRASLAEVTKGSPYHIRTDKDWEKLLHDAKQFELEAGLKRGLTNEYDGLVTMLNQVRNTMIGVPNEPHNGFYKIVNNIMRYNFVTRMGQMAFAASAETGNVMAQIGIRRMLQQIPEIRAAFKVGADGRATHPLVRLAQEEMGIYADMLNNKHYADHITDVEIAEGRASWKTSLDNVLQSSEQAVSFPLRKVMDLQERMLLIGTWRKLGQMAKNRSKLTDIIKKEWADYGLSEKDLTKLLDNIEKHGQFDGKRLSHPNHAAWGDTETWLKSRDAIFRMARRVVQENDPSNLPQLFNYQLGRAAFQFRTFQTGAIDKSLAYNANRLWRSRFKDSAAWAELSYQLMWSSIGLYAMVMEKSLLMGDKEGKKYRKEMLDPTRFAAMAFARTGYSTMIPGTVDSVTSLVGADSIFSQARSSGLHQDIVRGNPTVALGYGAWRALQGVAKTAFQPNYDFSAADLSAWQHLAPLNNMPGFNNLWNAAPDLFGLPEKSK